MSNVSMIDRYKEAIQGARDCVEKNKDGGVYLPDLLRIIDKQQSEKEPMITHIECLKKECDEWHKTAEFNVEKIIKLQALLEKSQKQCDELSKLVEKSLKLCDDKDATINRLFEIVEDWQKLYEGAMRLACAEIKLIPGLITRKKIDRLVREKGW